MLQYGEKLALLSQAASSILAQLPTLPPTPAQPYQGAQATGETRAALQRALDNYKVGHTQLFVGGPGLARSDTRSFGESHASELSSLTSLSIHSQSGLPLTPPSATVPLKDEGLSPGPIDPTHLNQSPAPIPAAMAPASPPVIHPSPVGQGSSVLPTLAETGIPISGGNGPAKGNLRDLHVKSSDATSQIPAQVEPAVVAAAPVDYSRSKYESAEEEKHRLQREERERILGNTSGQAPASAASPIASSASAEERNNSEREERKGISGQDQISDASKPPGPDESEDLPPYQAY